MKLHEYRHWLVLEVRACVLSSNVSLDRRRLVQLWSFHARLAKVEVMLDSSAVSEVWDACPFVLSSFDRRRELHEHVYEHEHFDRHRLVLVGMVLLRLLHAYRHRLVLAVVLCHWRDRHRLVSLALATKPSLLRVAHRCACDWA